MCNNMALHFEGTQYTTTYNMLFLVYTLDYGVAL